MKTLDQIDAKLEKRTPISALPFTINQPGSYYLTGNLTGASGQNGITILAANITLDLNGFVLAGVPGSLSGISAPNGGRNIAIRNGTVRNWEGFGADVSALDPVFEDLRLHNNGFDGLRASGGSIIRGCTASYNGGSGFSVQFLLDNGEIGEDAVVENCFATGNGGNGFTFPGAAITNCAARLNSGNGIAASAASTITNCLTSANLGDGINAAAGSTITNCTAKDNGGTYGILAGEGSTLSNCTAFSNDVEHGIHADLRSTVTNCTASGNDSAAADSWGISVGIQSTISSCTASANTNTNGTPTGSTGGGIHAGSSSHIQHCTVVGNKGDGIQIGSDSRVVGNNCDSNGFSGGNAAGIHSTGSDNRIEANNVTDNTRGIDVDSGGSLIIKNSASGSAGGSANNYVIAAGNADAAIEIPGTGFTSTNPWANFSF